MNMRFLYHALYRIVWPFFSLAHPVGARGRENIPEGGAVLCANHSALCDPILVCFACTLRWMVRPMAKIELSRVPALGWLLGKAGVIYVDRGHADVHAVKEALKWLKEGQKLLVFPEGTRVRKGEDVKGKSGAALFATRTGTPLVPIYVSWKKYWFRPSPVVIGKPIYPKIAGRKATAEELETCGLDTPELTVTVDYTYEDEARNEITQTFALQISRDPEEQKAAEEASDQEEGTAEEEITAYARVGDSRIVYRITANEYKALMDASYDALRHLEVLSADFSDVTQLDISLEGAAYSITAEGSGDGRTYSYLGEELEIGDLQSALESLKAESFTDERPTQKKEIGLTVHLDNENYPEVRIELYRYDGTNCLAVVDGTPVSLVARADVVDLIEAVNEIVLN